MMYPFFVFLLFCFTWFVTIPSKYNKGRDEGIKFCVENPSDCKTEYHNLKYLENKND